MAGTRTTSEHPAHAYPSEMTLHDLWRDLNGGVGRCLPVANDEGVSGSTGQELSVSERHHRVRHLSVGYSRRIHAKMHDRSYLRGLYRTGSTVPIRSSVPFTFEPFAYRLWLLSSWRTVPLAYLCEAWSTYVPIIRKSCVMVCDRSRPSCHVENDLQVGGINAWLRQWVPKR